MIEDSYGDLLPPLIAWIVEKQPPASTPACNMLASPRLADRQATLRPPPGRHLTRFRYQPSAPSRSTWQLSGALSPSGRMSSPDWNATNRHDLITATRIANKRSTNSKRETCSWFFCSSGSQYSMAWLGLQGPLCDLSAYMGFLAQPQALTLLV